jgi:hypothetical protein
MSSPGSVKVSEIEGHEVRCYGHDEHRLWRCDCADFKRTSVQFGEGFCAHTAVAIMRCLEDGLIEVLTESSQG